MSHYPSSLRDLWGERLLAGFSFCILSACGKNTNIAVKRGVRFSWINYTTWEHNEFLYMYLHAYIVFFVFKQQETVPKTRKQKCSFLGFQRAQTQVLSFQWFPQMNWKYSNKDQHMIKTSRISSVKIRDLFYSFTLLFLFHFYVSLRVTSKNL